MCRKIIATILMLVVYVIANAETISVCVKIRQNGNEEKIITHENLIKIKQFILKNGQHETYGNMYNNNPAYHTKGFCFYLNPDSGQQNINCDVAKSDFNSLIIRSLSAKKNQYRHIDFIDLYTISIIVASPTEDLTILQIRQLVSEALEEILAKIN